MTALHVLNPGSLSLLQDAGRFGFAHVGLSNGGPLDADAATFANRILQNDDDSTLIECTFGGLTLRAEGPTQVSVTGAALGVSIDDEEKPMWQGLSLTDGQELRLGFNRRGCRSYVAVRGGFSVVKSFGSTATVAREGIGGLDGGPLQTGDRLPIAQAEPASMLRLDPKQQPRYGHSITLRVVPAYQHSEFASRERERFFSSEYRVSPTSDRMGYRLQGKAVLWNGPALLSEGIALGAIQIPPDGQPIVLLNDRQTIGGYPKIGVVLSVDCALLGQLRPGDTVHFAQIDLATARRALRLAKGMAKTRKLGPAP